MVNIVLIVTLTIAVIAVLSFLVTRPDREAAARKREEEELWKKIETDLAVRCPASIDGVECQGMAKPLRGTNDRYGCPVCGGQFAGKVHGW